jgi:hypothetical protein
MLQVKLGSISQMSTAAKIIEVQYFGSLALQVMIVAVIIWRRLFLNARFFFAYVVWQTFSVACMYVAMHKLPPPYYFYTYWSNDAIDVLLAMAILVEIFNGIFAPYEGIRHLARILFISAAAILTSTSAVFLFFHHAEYTVPILTFVMVTERSVRILQLGLILALFAITRYLHLRWKNYLFGIALGFGFYAVTVLAVLVVRMTYGQSVMAISNLLEGTGYCVAVLIWATYTLQPDVATVPIVSLPSHELEKWDESLKNLLSKKQ